MAKLLSFPTEPSLKITSSLSQEPVAEAKVEFGFPPIEGRPNFSNVELLDSALLIFSDFTDTKGNTTILTRLSTIEDLSGGVPDYIANVEFVFRITGQDETETMRLIVNPLSSTQGQVFTITILEIGEPRIVDPNKLGGS